MDSEAAELNSKVV